MTRTLLETCGDNIEMVCDFNEPDITAQFSTLRGFWNEKKQDYPSFVTASKHIAQSIVASRKVFHEMGRDDVLHFINFSLEKVFSDPDSGREEDAKFFNDVIRFIVPDLIFGNRDAKTRSFLLENGMTEDEYEELMETGPMMRERTVIGLDNYTRCCRKLLPLTENEKLDPNYLNKPKDHYKAHYLGIAEPLHFAEIVTEYYNRYGMVMMHMEGNEPENENNNEKFALAMRQEISECIQANIPLANRFTWYSLLDQDGWETCLTGDKCREIYPVGLYDIHGNKRKVFDTVLDMNRVGFPQEVSDRLYANAGISAPATIAA